MSSANTDCFIIRHFVFGTDDDNYKVVFSIVTPSGDIFPGYAHRTGGNVAGEKSIEGRIGNISGCFGTKFKDWQKNTDEKTYYLADKKIGKALEQIDWFYYLDDANSDDEIATIEIADNLLKKLTKLPLDDLLTGVPTHLHRECQDHENELTKWLSGEGTPPSWTKDLDPEIRSAIEVGCLKKRYDQGKSRKPATTL